MCSPLIEADELSGLLEGLDSSLPPVVIDVRWLLGRGVEGNYAEYADGHLPHAAFLDLETGLAGPPRSDGVGGRHPLPGLSAASHAFRRAGVTADRSVVVYDGSTSLAAARAWWVLQYFGKHDVRVLNGGYAAWVEAGLPTEKSDAGDGRGDVALCPGGREVLTADDVSAYLNNGEGRVIDARARERYLGDVEPMDPVAGHIPGAVNLPTMDALGEGGRFDAAEIRQRLAGLSVDLDAPTAVYCGSGVQAAHLAFAMEVAYPQHRQPAVYVGSWSDWVSDRSRPVTTGSQP